MTEKRKLTQEKMFNIRWKRYHYLTEDEKINIIEKELNFSNAILENIDVRWACFEDANFENSEIINTSFQDGYFKRANFKNVKITNAKFEAGDFTGATFEGAILDNVSFKGAILNHINFKNCIFKNCINLTNADLYDINTEGSALEIFRFNAY